MAVLLNVIICQYMQFGQSACMFHISYGLQWRQGLRYIADKCNSALKIGLNDITMKLIDFISPIFNRWSSSFDPTCQSCRSNSAYGGSDAVQQAKAERHLPLLNHCLIVILLIVIVLIVTRFRICVTITYHAVINGFS